MYLLWNLVFQTFQAYRDDGAERLGAALAYYAVFSLAPLLIIVVALVNAFDGGATLGRVQVQIAPMVGTAGAETIISAMLAVQSSEGAASVTIVSIVTIIIGATRGFAALQKAMNTIWKVVPRRRGFAESLRRRLLSFVLVLAVCSLLLVSMTIHRVFSAVNTYLIARLPVVDAVWPIVDMAVSFVITTILFAAIYKILPDVDICWSDVWIGGAATSFLFGIGKFGLGLYLSSSIFPTGAAGSIMIFLAWVYYSAQILFLGAEFTQVYAKYRGSPIRQARGAVMIARN